MVKDGEYYHGLQTTNLKNLAKLFKMCEGSLVKSQTRIRANNTLEGLAVSAMVDPELERSYFPPVLNLC